MPIYEYQCQACGHHFEIVQRMSEEPLTQCPSCQKSELSKLISAPAFQLKGTGWYVTDFRDKNKKEAPKAETKTEVPKKEESKKDTTIKEKIKE